MKADHKKVARLVANARGQLDAVMRMIEDDRYCIDISTQLLAAQSLIRKANRESRSKASQSGSQNKAQNGAENKKQGGQAQNKSNSNSKF